MNKMIIFKKDLKIKQSFSEGPLGVLTKNYVETDIFYNSF